MIGRAEVRVVDHHGIPVAQLIGEVDVVNVAQVRDQLLGAAPNTAPGLVVDLAALTHLDSRGLRLLIELGQRLRWRRQHLRLAVPESSVIRRLLLLTHFDAILPLDTHVDEALTHIAAGAAAIEPSAV